MAVTNSYLFTKEEMMNPYLVPDWVVKYFIGDDIEPIKGKCPFTHKQR